MQGRYDVVVIGAGPAGEGAAMKMVKEGRRVAIVDERGRLGGNCVHVGTIPSKALRQTVWNLMRYQRDPLFQRVGELRNVPLSRVLARARKVIDSQVAVHTHFYDRNAVDIYYGTASFVDPHRLSITPREGGVQETLEFDTAVIATGSRPYRPADIDFDHPRVFDSDKILTLDYPVQKLGVIGCEYACIFAALGVEVKLVDGRDRILPFIDGEIGESLTRQMKKLGIQFVLPEEMDKVELLEGRVRTTFKSGKAIETEKFLYAAGRSGNTRGLGLEKLGVEVNKRGQITVNGKYQTAVPNIYAAGDVIGFPSLASTSMEQGRIAACHAFDLRYKTSLDPILPYGLYRPWG